MIGYSFKQINKEQRKSLKTTLSNLVKCIIELKMLLIEFMPN